MACWTYLTRFAFLLVSQQIVKVHFQPPKYVSWVVDCWLPVGWGYHSGPENLKKSRQKKNSWNQANQFFLWNYNSSSFKLFPRSKIDFCPFLKWQKMDFGQKQFREIDLFDFTGFFSWAFLNFLVPHPIQTYLLILPMTLSIRPVNLHLLFLRYL